MIYDYRHDIDGILKHTESNDNSLISSAYAIRAICNVILNDIKLQQTQTSESKPETRPTEPKPVSKPQKIENTPKTKAKENNDIVLDDNTNTEITANPVPTKQQSQTEPTTKPVKNPTNFDFDQIVDEQAPLYNKNFARHLSNIIKASKLSVNAFGKQFNIPTSYLYHITHGTVDMQRLQRNRYNYKRHAALTKQVINALNVDSKWLLFGDDKKSRPNYQRIAKKILNNEPATTTKMPLAIDLDQIQPQKTDGALIYELQKAAGLSQSDFANLLGFSVPKLSRIESNNEKPTSGELNHICQLLNISVTSLKSKIEAEPDNWYQPAANSAFIPLTTSEQLSDKAILDYFLDTPLKRNEYLIRHRLIGIQLLNQKGDVVCRLKDDNEKVKNLVTGDRVIAQIRSPFTAQIEHVTKSNRPVQDIQTFNNGLVEQDDTANKTLSVAKNNYQKLSSVNSHMSRYYINQSIIKAKNIKPGDTVDLAWYISQPNHVIIRTVHIPTTDKPVSKL